MLLVSLEYEEVRALADRILVIYEGKIVAEFPPDASEEELGIARPGGKQQHAERAGMKATWKRNSRPRPKRRPPSRRGPRRR